MRSMAQRTAIFATLLAVSWTVMTVCHEVGHLVGGWAGGATLIQADVVPWRLPYSLHQPDPFPLLTLWSGPLLGIAIPVAIAALIRQDWAWFIADFCLVANGAYLALAWVTSDRLLDTHRLLAAGASPLTIATFCLITIAVGYVRFRRDCVAMLSIGSKKRALSRSMGSKCRNGAETKSDDASGHPTGDPSGPDSGLGREPEGRDTDNRESGNGVLGKADRGHD